MALVAMLVVRDLLLVRGSLQDARVDVALARSALAGVDLAAADHALGAADAELSAARSRIGGPLWTLAARTPGLGSPVQTTRLIVDVASAAVDVGRVGLRDGGSLLGEGLSLSVDGGVLDLGPLQHAAEVLEVLPIGRLEGAQARLAAQLPGWLPTGLRDARNETLDLADDALQAVARARSLTTALPGFLGADGPRRYFVGVQTSAELRGTGGLIGYWAVLRIEDGHVSLDQSDVYEVDEPGDPGDGPRTGYIGSLSGVADEGAAADQAFRRRYDHVAATKLFSNVNVDPDLPTTADVALGLFEARTGERLDGVILLDPVGLQQLLQPSGRTLALSPELGTQLGLPDGLPTAEFAWFTTVAIYESLGSGHGDERSAALRELGDRAFQTIFDGSWDAADMVRAIAEVSGERHLQVFSRDAEEQAAFTDLGAAGTFSAGQSGDMLAVTANNAVGGKQDVHLGHAFDVSVRLDDVRRDTVGRITAAREIDVRISVDNPLPSAGVDEYIIGNCVVPGGDNVCFEGPPGWNLTWFSAWFPSRTRLQEGVAADGTPIPRAQGYRELVVVDHLHPTPPEDEASFDLRMSGSVTLEAAPGTLVYELAWWRQSKAIPDLLDVQVHAPGGWVVEDVEIVGGGSGRGMGVHGEGVPLVAGVVDGVAHLHGTVTSDTRLLVHLSGAST